MPPPTAPGSAAEIAEVVADLRKIDLALAGPDTQQTLAEVGETLRKIDELTVAGADRDAIAFLTKIAIIQVDLAVAAYERETGQVTPVHDPEADSRVRGYLHGIHREGARVRRTLRRRHTSQRLRVRQRTGCRRGARQRTAARRAAGVRSGNDPGAGDEPGPRPAVWNRAVLTADQRGAVVA